MTIQFFGCLFRLFPVVLATLLTSTAELRAQTSAAQTTFAGNVMAPLAVGDIRDPDAVGSQAEWSKFRKQLQLMKNLGVVAVTTDIWWGIVEGKGDDQFDWRYYDKLSDEIIRAGLKWVPILSFHQCGGNVGDTCDIPIPDWIWTKHIGTRGITSADDLKYLSESGNLSLEVVSVWGTSIVIADYADVMRAFQAHFAAKAGAIAEINVSLGPAGELRYPSYNSHDSDSGYPTRGRLQSYSKLARKSFNDFMVKRRGFTTSEFEPPVRSAGPPLAEDFFNLKLTASEFGKDFFDWYSDSLLDHGRLVLTESIRIFNSSSSAFRGIDIGAKIPGVHWRMAIDRSAELSAGLIRTSLGDLGDPARGHGYQSILQVFKDLQGTPGAPRIVAHFTCLEMSNGDGGPSVGSMAKALVFWVAAEAARLGVPIKGENALAGGVYDSSAWDNMENAIQWASYEGLTVLRMNDIASSPIGQTRFRELIQKRAP